MSRASYQTLIFNAEINRLLNNRDETLLIAGVIGDNEITNDFICSALELNNVHLILPPFNEHDLARNLIPENPLYRIQKFFKKIKKPFGINTLGASHSNVLDKLISKSDSTHYNNNLEYVELENSFHEAEYIAKKCQEMLNNNPKCKIAIITHTIEAKELYSIFLDKYELKYNNLFGKDILKHEGITLILIISELIYSKFNLKNLFALLSHQDIASKFTYKIKNVIRKRNRLASNIESIKQTVEKYESIETKEKFFDLIDLIEPPPTIHNFYNLLKHSIQLVEKIVPDIWNKYPDISATLSEILNANWIMKIDDIELFPELLKQVLSGGRIIGSKYNNIIICQAQDTPLINYDLTIISDINENKYPKSTIGSPWLNIQMQKELGLDSKLANIGYTLYQFYLNIQNKKTILTRAKKFNGSQTLPSPFILHTQYILGKQLKSKIAAIKFTELNTASKEIVATSNIFPEQISATDIETLIRSPYNFYAKKILKIRKIDDISDKPNLADFGNFFHHIAEDYANEFPKKSIEDLSNEYLTTLNIPEYSKNAWQTKIMAIAPELTEFEKTRRQNISSIHCEIKGELQLNIMDKKITIIAIADRIEIGKDGSAYIMDYKTGAVPSKKDVLSGLSPQLIIESIILAEGGFDLPSNMIEQIIYVKINSNKPYIKTTEIKLSKEDLIKHKQGLISLLEHYVSTNQYPIEPCQMKYDDYTHVARRL